MSVDCSPSRLNAVKDSHKSQGILEFVQNDCLRVESKVYVEFDLDEHGLVCN